MTTRPPNLEEIDAAAAAWVARRDAGLNAAEQRTFAVWCAENPLHAEALRRFEATWEALGRPRRTGVAATLRSELDSRLTRRRWWRAAAAVAGLILVAAGTWWLRPPAPASGTPAPALVRSRIMTPEQRTLSDGSRLELSEGAEVAVSFTPDARRLRLVRGEAHFSVVKDLARPFIVTAGGVEFRAVGTAFSVTLDPARVELLVTEGRVAVEATAAPQVAAATPLGTVDAGERLALPVAPAAAAAPRAPVPAVETVAPEEIARRQAWRRPRVEFSGAPLSEVVAVLNRQQPRRIELGDPTLAAVPLSGRFQADDLEVFTALLESGFDIAAEDRGGVLVLRRTR